ncbi:hypothetical protein V8E53_007913 [Lactarius tabidus]
MADSFYTLHPQNYPTQNVEVPPQTNGMPPYNVNRPDVNYANPYQNMNYNYEHWALGRDNGALYECSPPLAPPAVHLEGQYTYHKKPNFDHFPPEHDQDNPVASVLGRPSPMEYHPSARDIPDDGAQDRTPLIMPDFANPFSQTVPGSELPGTLAMESLKRLADRYLHDPGSRIDTLRLGLSPSSGRLRVTIMFDIDV